MTEQEIRAILREVPPSFTMEIIEEFAELNKRERSRRRIIWGVTAFASIMLLSIGLALMHTKPAVDVVLDTAPLSPATKSENTDGAQRGRLIVPNGWVIIHPEDVYYHCDPECAIMREGSVALPLETAIEFEKKACPVCTKVEAVQ